LDLHTLCVPSNDTDFMEVLNLVIIKPAQELEKGKQFYLNGVLRWFAGSVYMCLGALFFLVEFIFVIILFNFNRFVFRFISCRSVLQANN
jgi:hypothetical protein